MQRTLHAVRRFIAHRSTARMMSRLVTRMVDIYRRQGLLSLLLSPYRYVCYNHVSKNTRFKLRTRLQYLAHRVRYDAPAPPRKLLTIDPDDIEYRCGEIGLTEGLSTIKNGEWDDYEKATPVDSYWRIKGLKQRFEEQRDWEETVYHQTVRERIANSGEYWGYRSLEEFERTRLPYVERLYRQISEEGYRLNGHDQGQFPESDFRNDEFYEVNQLEPLVLIGRDGRMFLRDGHHRYAIADILGIEIPVQVMARHERWQRIRDEIHNARSVDELAPEAKENLSHPDVQDVIPDERWNQTTGSSERTDAKNVDGE